MGRPLWFVTLLKRAFPGRFILARLTRIPILGRLLERWLFAGDSLYYLPRERVIVVNRPIEQPGEMVLPSRVVEHFIAQARYLWVMNACICRDASRCQDYPVELGCLFLGQAAMGINPRLGRPVTQKEALAHVRRCREAGLVHLVGRNKLDLVWLGVSPGERLLTICNCCPCCCLWRVLPHVAPHIGARIARFPGVTVAVTDRCQGCGTCTRGVCFVGAIRLERGRAVIGQECRGCGRCVDACPQGAIELRLDGAGRVAEAIGRLSALVDVS